MLGLCLRRFAIGVKIAILGVYLCLMSFLRVVGIQGNKALKTTVLVFKAVFGVNVQNLRVRLWLDLQQGTSYTQKKRTS